MAGPITYVEHGEALHKAVREAGHRIWTQDGQVMASDPQAVQAIINGFDPMPYLRARKLEALQEAVKARADLFALMDGGSATNVTNTQFSSFWTASINRYRTIKASILAAPDRATLAAISLTSGWPNNP